MLDAAGSDGVNHPAASILPQYTRARRLLLSRKLLRCTGGGEAPAAIAARFLLPPVVPASVHELPKLLHRPSVDAPAGSSYLALRRALLSRRFAGLHASVEDSILQRMATESMQRAMSAFREEQEVFHGDDTDGSDSSASATGDLVRSSQAAAASRRKSSRWGVPAHMYQWTVAGRMGAVRSSTNASQKRHRSDSALLPAGAAGALSSPAAGPGAAGAFAAAVGSSGAAASAFGGVRGGGNSTQDAEDMPTVALESLLARRYAGVTALAFRPASGSAAMTHSAGGMHVMQTSARNHASISEAIAVFGSVRGALTFVGVPHESAAAGTQPAAARRRRADSAAPEPTDSDVFGGMFSLGDDAPAAGGGASAFDSAAGADAGRGRQSGGASAHDGRGVSANSGGSDSDDEQHTSMTPRVWSTVAAHTAVVTDVDWSRDGSSLLSVGLDRCLRLWRVQAPGSDQPGIVQQLRAVYRPELLTHVAFFPLNGNMAVVAGVSSSKPATAGSAQPPPKSGLGAFFSSLGSNKGSSKAGDTQHPDTAGGTDVGDASLQVTDKLYGVLQVLNLSTGKVVQTVSLPWPVTCMTFAESGMQLFVGDLSGKLHVCGVPLDMRAQLQLPLSPLRCVADLQALMATGGLGGTAGSALGNVGLFKSAAAAGLQGPCRVSHVGHLWRPVQRSTALLARNAARACSTGKPRSVQPLHGNCFFQLVHKPFDSHLRVPMLLASTDEGALLALALQTAPPQALLRLQAPAERRTGGGAAGAAPGAPARSFRGASSSAAASAAAGSPAGLSAGGGSSGLVYAYVQPAYCSKRPRGDDCIFTCLAPCSDSDVLAAGTAGGEGMLLDPHARTITRTYVANLLAHSKEVTCVAWGSQERLVGTADATGAVVFWRHSNA